MTNIPHWNRERFDHLIPLTELDVLRDMADRVFIYTPQQIADTITPAELGTDYCWRTR